MVSRLVDLDIPGLGNPALARVFALMTMGRNAAAQGNLRRAASDYRKAIQTGQASAPVIPGWGDLRRGLYVAFIDVMMRRACDGTNDVSAD